MRGRRYFGSVVVSLPDGIVLECYPSSSINPAQIGVVEKSGECLTEILQPGDSFLNILHVKSAQTMHLNSFSNTSQRRMYARLKWGEELRACEFLCEFCVDPNHSGRRIVTIHILCVNETALQKQQQQQQSFFVTRHNVSGAIVFIDVACFPIIGHFPSELFGKSLFKLLHPDDIENVKNVHQKLQNSRSGEIVATKGLRLINFNGEIVFVDSEWTAFVNPWTQQMEMVVGRHKRATKPEINPQISLKTDSISTNKSDSAKGLEPAVNNLGNYIERIVETLVMNGDSNCAQPLQNHINREPTLSCEQIKILENVNRFIKSQPRNGDPEYDAITLSEDTSKTNTKMPMDFAKDSINLPTPSLTQELLQKHDLRCELESKDNWKKKLICDLNLKRMAQGSSSEPNAKVMRFSGANSRSQSVIASGTHKSTKKIAHPIFIQSTANNPQFHLPSANYTNDQQFLNSFGQQQIPLKPPVSMEAIYRLIQLTQQQQQNLHYAQ